jgi:acid stress-induced BolA-like protein IbaG/YrbA
MVTPESIQLNISQGMHTKHLQVVGDGRHFEAVVVSEEFEGKSRVQRHQLVFKVLGDRMRDEMIHALSLKTFTPQEWLSQN